MERFNAWAIGTGSVMVAALLTGLVASVWKAWAALGIACFAFVATIVLLVIARSMRPLLHIGLPVIESSSVVCPSPRSSPGPMVGTTTSDAIMTTGTVSEPLCIAYLSVWNSPKNGSQAADDVFVTFRFLNVESDVLYDEVIARWSHLTQHIKEEESHSPRPICLPANGTKFRTDVVFKYLNEDRCYAVNDQSRFVTQDFRHRPLDDNPIIVEVCAQGSNAKTTARYRLDHDGCGSEPRLTKISA